jgi:hypothetical protein
MTPKLLSASLMLVLFLVGCAPVLNSPQPVLPKNEPEFSPAMRPAPTAESASGQASAPITEPVSGEPDTATQLYISGTFHIETNRKSWPDVDAFLAFIEHATTLGMKWSIGADVGWLEGEPRAAEVVQKTTALGVEWDVHTHVHADRARAAALIRQFGGTPTSVYSGFLIQDWDKFVPEATYRGENWVLGVLWGAVNCPGHRPGCDEQTPGVWSPSSADNYTMHDPAGMLIHVGGGTHQLADGRALAEQIAAGQVSAPVVSFTVMVTPSTLQIFPGEDGLEEIRVFYAEMNEYGFVRWATIEETARAWDAAGRIPSQVGAE